MINRLTRYFLFLIVLIFYGGFTSAQEAKEVRNASQMPMRGKDETTQSSKDEKLGVVRTYFIEADEIDWDYTPNGKNTVGLPHSETGDAEAGPPLSHRIYHKAVYLEYTDENFRTLKIRPQRWEHLGLLGPLIRAEVGDSIRIVFKNNTHLSVTMHPHGLEYKKDAEGTLYKDGTTSIVKLDDAVAPGHTYIYIWTVPERSGPAVMDESSVLWMYHSHFVESTDINTGLIGPIIVTRRGSARVDGSPKDVDREFITDFSIFDETDSWFFERNAGKQARALRSKVLNPALREEHTLYTINGYSAGNLPIMVMKKGEHVRWYLLSSANEDDVHTAHWHGNTAVWNKMRMDSIFLGPMAMAVADMIPDNEGIWLFHCHVADHFNGGMMGRYQVLP